MKHGALTRLAQEVGKKPQTIWQIKEATARPSWTTAKKLAAVTGADPAIFLDGSKGQIEAVITAWAENNLTAEDSTDNQDVAMEG